MLRGSAIANSYHKGWTMKARYTERGFALAEFTDQYGSKCSLQESSLATGPCVWLGCDDADPKVFIPHGEPAWRPLELPVLPPGGHYMWTTRMHLTREMVAELLPLLQHFVEHGTLPKAT